MQSAGAWRRFEPQIQIQTLFIRPYSVGDGVFNVSLKARHLTLSPLVIFLSFMLLFL
jgi:hypothetical protein